MPLDVLEDVAEELEDFIYLARVGCIEAADGVYQSILKQHASRSFPILAEYIEMLLDNDRDDEVIMALADVTGTNFDKLEQQFLDLARLLSMCRLNPSIMSDREEACWSLFNFTLTDLLRRYLYNDAMTSSSEQVNIGLESHLLEISLSLHLLASTKLQDQEPVIFLSRLPSISADKVFQMHCLPLLRCHRLWEARKFLSLVMLQSQRSEAIQYFEDFARNLSQNPPSWERRLVELAGIPEYLHLLVSGASAADEKLLETFYKFTQSAIAMETLLNIIFEDSTGYRGVHELRMNNAIQMWFTNGTSLANTCPPLEIVQALEGASSGHVALPKELCKLIEAMPSSPPSQLESSIHSNATSKYEVTTVESAVGIKESNLPGKRPVEISEAIEESSPPDIFPFDYPLPPLYSRHDPAKFNVSNYQQYSINELQDPVTKRNHSDAVDSAHHLVIGIDFGTTYSAVAWAQSSDELEVMNNWPITTGRMIGSKVPSEIAYSSDDSARLSWGYNIHPRSRKVKWFKLGLETTEEVISCPPDKNAVIAVQDYLRLLHTHIIETLNHRFSPKTMRNTRIEYVLTVPAIFSDESRKRFQLAATRAGIGVANSSLQLLDESESAAIYCLKIMEKLSPQIEVGDKMIICDAGGGTVDLISYELKQISNIPRLETCSTPTGDFCGSTFIDREFEKFLRIRMGVIWDTLSIISRQLALKNFEVCKMQFRNDPNEDIFTIEVPTMKDGYLDITREEMQSFFNPIIQKIWQLIKEQIEMVSANTIILVGGLGGSEYLFQSIKAWATPLGIKVVQPADAATAVVQGAVLKGMASRATTDEASFARKSRISYGFVVKQDFEEGHHQEIDAEFDPHTGKKMARGQIRWIIKANQLVSNEEIFKYKSTRTFKNLHPWRDALVASSIDPPPTRLAAGEFVYYEIHSDLTHLNIKRNFQKIRHRFSSFYFAEYDLVLSFNNDNLRFYLSYQGKQYGSVIIPFGTLA